MLWCGKGGGSRRGVKYFHGLFYALKKVEFYRFRYYIRFRLVYSSRRANQRSSKSCLPQSLQPLGSYLNADNQLVVSLAPCVEFKSGHPTAENERTTGSRKGQWVTPRGPLSFAYFAKRDNTVQVYPIEVNFQL